ncbi:alpha/beta fold hydrolase [Tsukamurella sp. 8F]|uniref:thioesterase II family protein n=1 Tax=unclassified Tsukamurella TaxID=2633480 RepID=UPI0023B9053E|nr:MULTISPECIES: alpha/beta fold hydrolase [unclassified Tsukamurella]MDF0531689.1 alpha/beta fold hydrolase [Tsukamurella sp. 8J]MDF0588935.1 alpha/beta fold hydrolase [Tsukamurella sp. 8F]
MATSIRSRLGELSPDQRVGLAERLRQNAQRRSSAWFVKHADDERPVRLFCFPYAGSGASVFHTWPALLPDYVQLCALQLPGRETRLTENPYRQLRALVSDLGDEIIPLLDRPFAFFGHSMGALVAFELARQLGDHDVLQPSRLFLSAFRAPQLPNPNIKIFHLPDEVLKTVLAKEGMPRGLLDSDEVMAALLPALRADLEVCDTYKYAPQAPLSIPISMYGGLQDVRVGRADLAAWGDETSASFDLTMLPGPHLFLQSAQEQLVASIARKLGPPADRPRATAISSLHE